MKKKLRELQDENSYYENISVEMIQTACACGVNIILEGFLSCKLEIMDVFCLWMQKLNVLEDHQDVFEAISAIILSIRKHLFTNRFVKVGINNKTFQYLENMLKDFENIYENDRSRKIKRKIDTPFVILLD